MKLSIEDIDRARRWLTRFVKDQDIALINALCDNALLGVLSETPSARPEVAATGETPRTDKWEREYDFSVNSYTDAYYELLAHARQLERELAAARSPLDTQDAARYRAVKACDWIGLRVQGQEFVGVSNLDAWADARLDMNKSEAKNG